MLQTSSAILTLMFILAYTESFSVNKTAELISTYAKVAHWGTATSKPLNEGRSSGQTLWTHRSDATIRGGQNLKRKQPVTYYYSMQAPSSKVDQTKEDPIPSKGEVQDRFNPRPYFDFVFDDPPRSNQQPDTFKSSVKQSGSSVSKPKPPSIVYGTPIDSFPGFDKPPPSVSDSKPPADAYSSPFSSYNPPEVKPDGSKNKAPASFDYPPNENQAPSLPSGLYGPPNDNQPPAPPELYGAPNDSKPPKSPAISYEPPDSAAPSSDSYNAPPPDVYGPPSDTYGPPNSMLKPPKQSNKPKSNMKPGKYPDYSFHPPLAMPPQEDSMPKQPDHSYLGPPPPDSDGDSDTSYYAPPPPASGNGNGDHSHPPPDNFHHGPHGGGMDNGNGNDDGPPTSQTAESPGPVEQPYFDHPPTNHDHHSHAPSMAEGDLSPPPAEAAYGKIPQYLDHQPNDHDFYHYGHHDVYHEVHHPTTTTTTEAPRAGHYSYYYLGRKLWYIPLYFSVYFIVYVTVLILKSIARHKIQFSHNFDKARESRELDINSVNQTVIDAIETVKNKYM